jgi:hypothetical protein
MKQAGDVFSYGMLLYQLLTCLSPFARPQTREEQQIKDEEEQARREQQKKKNAFMAAILDRCQMKDSDMYLFTPPKSTLVAKWIHQGKRPSLSFIQNEEDEEVQKLGILTQLCWTESPRLRPSIGRVLHLMENSTLSELHTELQHLSLLEKNI